METVRAVTFMVCVFLVFEEGTSLEYITNTFKDYVTVDLLLSEEKFFMFQTKACTDAHVTFKSTWDGDLDNAEVVIGAWENSKSAIRPSIDGNNRVEFSHSPLDCEQFKPFWVSWAYNIISVGIGNILGQGKFMEASMDTTDYRFVAVGTNSVTGSWRCADFCKCHGDPHMTTFDSKRYRIASTGDYIIERLKPYSLDIIGDFYACLTLKSCLRRLFFDYMGYDVYLMQQGVYIGGVLRSNETIYVTPDFEMMVLQTTGRYRVMVFLSMGVTIRWDYKKAAEIINAFRFFDQTLGLCGTFTNTPEDDFTLPDRVTVEPDKDTFVESWAF